jgi:Tetratricopeptide repeat
MRAFVFTDKALTRHAGQFVWLSIDTEKARNAPFVQKYPIRAWPSFYVIDPKTETVAVRWVGGATVAQLDKLFDDGARAVKGGERGAVEVTLAKADRLYGEGRYADAAPAYREALRSLKPGSASYARAVDALLYCLQSARDNSGCAALAREALPRLRQTASAANVAGTGLDCALKLPAGAPERAESIATFETATREIIADRGLRLAADDRSALYDALVSARDDARDEEGARRIARQWAAELEGDAERAKTPEQRTTLDPDRLNAYESAGEIEKAIPMLERSERDFPGDYNPPARLAFVYLKLSRAGEALAASDRALARVYGPRRIRVLLNRADIQKASGDTAAAKATLEEAVAFAESLPPGQRSEETIASLKKKLEAL